jgi:hypothetical protein
MRLFGSTSLISPLLASLLWLGLVLYVPHSDPARRRLRIALATAVLLAGLMVGIARASESQPDFLVAGECWIWWLWLFECDWSWLWP